jgi:hypothetical protein
MTDNYTVEQHGPVTVVRFSDCASGWEQWIMLGSDRHHDNPRCDRELEMAQLRKASERDALILDAGDLLDAMQGRFDPRRNYEDVRPEDAGIDYYDRIVTHAAEDYSPYLTRWVLLAKGNHELAALNNTNHDLTTALAHEMNRRGGNVQVGGIGGWVKFQFAINGTRRCSLNLKYHHGAGGGGPVTRGVIQTNRQAVYLPDADIVWNGHTHDAWVMPIARERLLDSGRVARDLVWYVRTPGYKNDYSDGASGWHNERWGPPKPLGCCWLRLYVENSKRAAVSVEAVQDVC